MEHEERAPLSEGPGRTRPAPRVADKLITMAADLGIKHAFGVIDDANAVLADALAQNGSIEAIQTRQEAGAAFAAAEASLASKRPVLLCTTTGPGVLTALNGLVGARWDGARILVLSGVSGPIHRRRLPIQDSDTATMPIDVLAGTGPWFDFGAIVEDPAELGGLENILSLGFGRPGGFIAHLAIPTGLQARPAPPVRAPPQVGVTRPRYASDVASAVAEILRDGNFAVWVGHGARNAASQVRQLVDVAGAPVIASPRAKGLVSERHPLYLGVSGVGGHPDLDQELGELGIHRTLVLGSRLSEATTQSAKGLVPAGGLIHVDIDRRVFGTAFPDAETVGVEAEVGAFLDELLPFVTRQRLPRPPRTPFPAERPVTDIAGVHPRSVMHAVQRVVVDGTDAIVLAESGDASRWTNHHLCFTQPGRYRCSPSWGSVGHMAAGAIGTAVASAKNVVVICGDGPMLVNSELNAAVQHRLPVVWIVMNDAGYGIDRDAMRTRGLVPFGAEFPETDFAALARAQGAMGRTVVDAVALDSAIIEALQARCPFVIDVKTGRGRAFQPAR